MHDKQSMVGLHYTVWMCRDNSEIIVHVLICVGFLLTSVGFVCASSHGAVHTTAAVL